MKLCKKKKYILVASLVIAICSHTYFIWAYFNGNYMLGGNDGLSQMLPFKKLLHDQYTEGNFFYSNQFGMGGGVYSQLGYYFSNSISFYISSGILYILEKLQLIAKPDLYTWAQLILPISIIRQTIIIFFATMYFRYFNIRHLAAFLGAVIYGTSVIYFRHVTYWEFFADAMIWLPLLLLGMERIIKEGKSGLFIIAVAITLFDNFYFAYIHCLLMLMYLIFRWMIPMFPEEIGKWEQCKRLFIGGILGFGMSAVSFIPSVYGYLQNHRIPYEKEIPLLGVVDNPLLDARIIYIPAIAIICLFIISFYKNKQFRFFAALTILCFFLHFSPKIASVFNGFSAPQYRWEYFLSLMAGGVVAIGIEKLQTIRKRPLYIAIASSICLYMLAYFMQITHSNRAASLLVITLLISVCITIVFSLVKRRDLFVVLILLFVVTANMYQKDILSEVGNVENTTDTFMNSNQYNGKDQLALLDLIKEKEGDAFYRIDWMTKTRNNTPIVQDFNGFSVYSSILNQYLLYFYLDDLEIDMKRESVSRYMTLGDRANLFSLLSGKYMIMERGKSPIPYGFKEVYAVGKYVAYENESILPFLQATNTIYSEADLQGQPAISKEHAMLNGIIVQDDTKENPISENENLIEKTQMKWIHAEYAKDRLTVNEDQGGIDFHLPTEMKKVGDYYIKFHIERTGRDKGYTIQVNDYRTTRKKQSSIYKTGVNDVTIRVQADHMISLRLPKGTYKFKNIELYFEDYDELRVAKAASEHLPLQKIEWKGNKLQIEYENEQNKKLGFIPVPYEKGWQLYLNDQKADVLKANYAFIGIPLAEGKNDIRLVYTPPYFRIGLIISAFSCIVTLFFFLYKRKRKMN